MPPFFISSNQRLGKKYAATYFQATANAMFNPNQIVRENIC